MLRGGGERSHRVKQLSENEGAERSSRLFGCRRREGAQPAHSPQEGGYYRAGNASVKTRGGRLELVQRTENSGADRVVPSRCASRTRRIGGLCCRSDEPDKLMRAEKKASRKCWWDRPFTVLRGLRNVTPPVNHGGPNELDHHGPILVESRGPEAHDAHVGARFGLAFLEHLAS